MGRSGWASAPDAARAQGSPCYPRPPVKVLLADDDALIRSLVSDLLADLGHAVVVAADGAEAVTLSAREPPDVLVLDLLMPRLSGLDALRAMRDAGVAAPAVLLTAITDGSARALEGADEVAVVLEKPVSRRALARALARATAAR
jgi:CheY-like chemotaxis protein